MGAVHFGAGLILSGLLSCSEPRDSPPILSEIDAARATLPQIAEGEAAFRSGQYTRAIELYRAVLERMPAPERAASAAALFGLKTSREYRALSASLRANLGVSLFRTRRLEAARDELRLATAIEPAAPQHHKHLALVLYHLKDDGAAIEAFERAIQLKDSDPRTYLHLGRTSARHGREQTARWALAQAQNRYLADRSGAVPAWGDLLDVELELAKLEKNAGNLGHSERLVRSVLARAPGHAEARFVLSQILSATNRTVEAEREKRQHQQTQARLDLIEARLAEDPGGAPALHWVADEYRELGLYHLAYVHYRQLLERDSGDRKARVALVDLWNRVQERGVGK